MNQKEFASQELDRAARYQRIQTLCACYVETGDTKLREELMDLVWKHYKPVAASSIFKPDFLDELLSITCQRFLNKLNKIRNQDDPPLKSPDAFIKTIIRNAALDILKRERKRNDIVSLSPGEDDDAPELDIPDNKWLPEGVVDAVNNEIDKRIIRDFCHDLMTIRSSRLPHVLSVMYTLIVPYCLGLTLGSHTLSDWVWTCFEKSSFQFLTDDSEKKVRSKIDRALFWADHFREELEKDTGLLSPDKPLKDTYPPEIMTSKQKTQWVLSLKTTLAGHLLKKMRENPDCRQRGIELIDRRSSNYSKYMKILQRGED